MNWVDLVIVATVVFAAAAGFRLGFVTRVLSWIGLLVGVVVSLLVLGPILEDVDAANPARAIVIAIAVVLIGAFGGQAIGFIVGNRLRPGEGDGGLSHADAALGLCAGVVGTVLVVWLLLPVLTQRGGPVADEVATSWVGRQLDERLPPPPDALHAFRSIVGDDNFPDVFADIEPDAPLGPPPPSTGLSAATADAVATSVVKIEGIACRKIQDGTGFVVADGLVATNAHVVAGESSTDVIRNDGRRISSQVVAFDPARDLALLQVPGLDRAPLPLARAEIGDVGGVFGHPGGEPLRIAPFEVARRLDATGRDIYGRSPVVRSVLEAAADLAPGDSGSPLVDPAGEVIGITFAISSDRQNVAYALDTDELDAVLAGNLAPTGTGPCVSSST
jgi:S1-C subfamily serine protease